VRPHRRTNARGIAALPVALVLIAVVVAVVAGVLAAGALEIGLTQRHIATAQALAAADGCVSHVLPALPVGWDFGDVLSGADGRNGTADDGRLSTPPGCTAVAAGGADRIVVTATAAAGGGRRTVLAVVGRWNDGGVPSPLWAADANALAQIDGPTQFAVAGVPRLAPALVAPLAPLALDDWLGSHPTTLGPGVAAPEFGPPPPLTGLADRARTTGVAAAAALVPGVPVPALAFAGGDLVIDRPLHGAGILVVDGRLRLSAPLDFEGVVVAVRGVDLDASASLTVLGSLWLGADPAAPARSRGTLLLTYDPAAMALAAARLPLPRRPKLLSLRDHEG